MLDRLNLLNACVRIKCHFFLFSVRKRHGFGFKILQQVANLRKTQPVLRIEHTEIFCQNSIIQISLETKTNIQMLL